MGKFGDVPAQVYFACSSPGGFRIRDGTAERIGDIGRRVDALGDPNSPYNPQLTLKIADHGVSH